MTLLTSVIERVPGFTRFARQAAQAMHGAVLGAGKPARQAIDVLHGKWLGHPAHPLLTDLTIGGWSFGSLFDLAGLLTRSERTQRAGDALTGLGTAAAVPTALTGLADYSAIKRDAAPLAALHAIVNDVALTFYGLSLIARRQDRRGLATTLSLLGFGWVTVGGYLGAELVFRKRVGVNHAPKPSGPGDWTAVMPESELAEHQPRRVEVEGAPVLLYRFGGTVYAIGAVCSHAGGPLEEGTFDGTCVQCPWHDSVFDVRDGRVVHGPATFPQPRYRARIENGQVEIQLAAEES